MWAVHWPGGAGGAAAERASSPRCRRSRLLTPTHAPYTPVKAVEGRLLDGWRSLRRVRVPLVAAVDGYALGGGCELAMACDMIVAGEGAVFGQVTGGGVVALWLPRGGRGVAGEWPCPSHLPTPKPSPSSCMLA